MITETPSSSTSENASPAPESTSISLKWTEIYSLAALSASIAISWIAYHEYQPQLLEKFNFADLTLFLIVAKAVVLVIIPPIAGWLSDLIMQRTGRFFMVFSVGIGITAMVFMVVASIIGAGPLAEIKLFLPYMIVVWLIAMNIFTSPALSMIDSFAPTKKLPLVVGFLFFVTQLIYALEPVVAELVEYFGDTLTFVVGGLLIGGTGYLFHRVSSDEVVTRRKKMMEQTKRAISNSDLSSIMAIGLVLGTGNAFLVEYIPIKVENTFTSSPGFGAYLSFGLLGFSALLAVLASGFVARQGFKKVLNPSIVGLIASLIFLVLAPNFGLFVFAGIMVAVSFALLNVTGLPYAISKLSVRNITFGVGVFIGASYIVEGILEYLYL